MIRRKLSGFHAGLPYYSNLGFFLGDFTVPSGSSYEERELYLQFIQRLDAAGALKPGAEKKVQRRSDAQWQNNGIGKAPAKYLTL
jgi:hypothetical protein